MSCNGLQGRVLRLVPMSGVQFVDVRLRLDAAAATRHHFIEETIGGAQRRRVLLPLEGDGVNNVVMWHPVTMLPVPPNRVLSISELEAIMAFAGRWVPVPYLRFTGRAADGRPTFDSGPANWTRLFIHSPGSDDGMIPTDGARHFDAVLAFDTAIDGQSRVDVADYLAPTREDVILGSTFVLASAVDAVGCMLREAWVVDWLRECLRAPRAEVTAPAGPDEPAFQLEHVAQYITLLRALLRSPDVPQVRFSDTISGTLPVAVAGVDLILDIGSEETAALLVASGDGAESTQALALRDLTDPTVVHRAATFASTVEFDRSSLAIEPFSRRSRRRNAFLWPSLVRVGAEARRLSMRGSAVEGVTGLSGLKDQLSETDTSAALWRYAGSPDRSSTPGPMVTDPLLARLSENGEPLSRAADRSMPAIRPRFSRSSMMTLFVAEILLHALSQINAPDRGETNPRDWGAKRLHHIIVTSPLAMPESEQNLLITRINDAVSVVWEGLGWEGASAPPRPTISLASDSNTGSQVLHLYEEVLSRFGGRFGEFVDVVKRRHNGRRWLRLTSLEIDARNLSLVTVDYPETVDGTVNAETVAFKRFPHGTERILTELVDAHLLPALTRGLDSAMASDALSLLEALSGKRGAGHLVDDPYFVSRFGSRVLRPAAVGLLGLYEGMAATTAAMPEQLSLGTLVALGGGSLEPIAGQLEAMAARAGLRGLRLPDVSLTIDRRRLGETVRKALGEAMQWSCDLAAAHAGDQLLLGDRLSRIPDAMAMVLARLPLPASRIVALHGRQLATLEGFEATPVADRGRLVGVVSAFMTSRDLLQQRGFRIVSASAATNVTGRMWQGAPHGAGQAVALKSGASAVRKA